MKNNYIRTLCAAILLVPMLWSCQKENMNELGSADGPQIQGVVSGVICETNTAALANAGGNTTIDFCDNGSPTTPGPAPCGPNPGQWGSITYSKQTISTYPFVQMVLDVQLNNGWIADGYTLEIPYLGPIQPLGSIPPFISQFQILSPARNQFQVVVDLPAELYGASCFDWTMSVSVFKTNLFGVVVPGSDRLLYSYDPTGAGSEFVIDRCYAACPANETTVTAGTCQGCRASVSATFTACSNVSIASCKDIRQVVIVYDDCSREYHDNLTGTSLSYAAAAGKSISHIFVRSGCRANTAPSSQDNVDTNGFNYSNIGRYRLDGNCLTPSCN